mmetsp:Transcript_3539/g.8527  ORF Transcript_3539/g.8527 Transcript_3539/m.8527 type:complete len:571 (-) Transcript_3539:2546-4258(-)
MKVKARQSLTKRISRWDPQEAVFVRKQVETTGANRYAGGVTGEQRPNARHCVDDNLDHIVVSHRDGGERSLQGFVLGGEELEVDGGRLSIPVLHSDSHSADQALGAERIKSHVLKACHSQKLGTATEADRVLGQDERQYLADANQVVAAVAARAHGQVAVVERGHRRDGVHKVSGRRGPVDVLERVRRAGAGDALLVGACVRVGGVQLDQRPDVLKHGDVVGGGDWRIVECLDEEVHRAGTGHRVQAIGVHRVEVHRLVGRGRAQVRRRTVVDGARDLSACTEVGITRCETQAGRDRSLQHELERDVLALVDVVSVEGEGRAGLFVSVDQRILGEGRVGGLVHRDEDVRRIAQTESVPDVHVKVVHASVVRVREVAHMGGERAAGARADQVAVVLQEDRGRYAKRVGHVQITVERATAQEQFQRVAVQIGGSQNDVHTAVLVDLHVLIRGSRRAVLVGSTQLDHTRSTGGIHVVQRDELERVHTEEVQIRDVHHLTAARTRWQDVVVHQRSQQILNRVQCTVIRHTGDLEAHLVQATECVHILASKCHSSVAVLLQLHWKHQVGCWWIVH